MRVPIYVPLLLMVAAAGLFAIDVVSVVGATREPTGYHVTHSDDNQTFVAAILAPLEPGEELRSPDAGGWVIVVRERLSDPEALELTAPDETADASIDVFALHRRGGFLIIPAWQVDRLAAGGEVDVLHEAEILDRLRFAPGAIPAPEGPAAHGWPDSLAVVFLLRNDTQEYPELAAALAERGGDAMPGLYAVQASVIARDPWLRGTAVALAAAALVLAVLPRLRPEPGPLAAAPAGSSVELAAAGHRFLLSIRNAYVALAAAVALLGIPLMLAFGLFAKNATGPAGHLEFIGAGDPWEGEVWLQMLFIVVAGVVAAARPALDAQLALRRWRRAEANSPFGGELGP